MMKRVKWTVLGAMGLCLSACDNSTSTPQESLELKEGRELGKKAKDKHTILFDFEDGRIPTAFNFEAIDASIIDYPQGKASSKALSLLLKAEENYTPIFNIQPEQAWDWSGQASFSFSMDLSNPLTISTHLFVTVYDKKNEPHTRSVAIPAGQSKTFYIELKGQDLDIESGIRSNPPSWESDASPYIWRWGTKNIDLSGIARFKFSVTSLLQDRELIIDNIRLTPSPKADPNYLVGLVDEFGQNAKMDYSQKIHSVEELQRISEAELAGLSGKPWEERTQYGGWKAGPKLEATGFFRTEKHQGKWSLVDPEGHLFFSTGIANVRMSNTSTITGYDFDLSSLNKEGDTGVTPEDSKGLNRVPDSVVPTRFVASPLRAQMFTSLPRYDDELANHFGYRESVHSGALKKGETFSFYRANLERKYGETTPESFMDKWRTTTVDRMLDWGFTSFGNWIAPEFYHLNRFPYFANGWIIGDFKKVSSGADYWSPLPDPFDPEFAKRAEKTVSVIAEEVKNNPWCVGVFIDNEKSWGREGSLEGHYGIVIHTLNRNGDESPTKTEFTRLMREKYKTITALNTQWGTKMTSWNAFNKSVAFSDDGLDERLIPDFSMMLLAYAEEYFKIVDETLNRAMPNHMYLGVRFADWGMTSEIVAAAAKYTDVVSYNFYKEGLHPKHWAFLADIDRPSIIGEFHMGATDTGLLNPGLVHTASQAERAKAYKAYVEKVIDNPYFVGLHWFQYTDSPLTGRAYDGENYNVGFVSVTDVPYKEMIDAAKSVNKTLYVRRFGKSDEQVKQMTNLQ